MISEELMPIAWHPKRWWNFACQEIRKSKLKRFLLSNAFNVYNLRVFCHFKSLLISSHFGIVQMFF